MKPIKNSKFIIVLCFILFNISTASSQLRFGIKGGFDVSSNRINKDILNASNRLGFQVGATLEARVPIVGLGFEISALYGHQEFDRTINDKNGVEYDLSDYNYIRVPLNLKYKFNIVGLCGAFVSAGPYAEFKMSGADFEKTGSVSEQWDSKTFAAGVNAGAGVELFKHLEIGMYYRKSLTNNYNESNGLGNLLKNKPDNWSVDLTYFF